MYVLGLIVTLASGVSSGNANASNSLLFDGHHSKVSIPTWTATGDFTITLSEVVFGDRGISNGLATLFGNGSFDQYSGLQHGGVLIGPTNRTSLENFPVGHKSTVILKRVGSTVSMEIVDGAGPVSLTYNAPYVINRIGDLNDNPIFTFDGSIGGLVTMIDHVGGDNRTYNFNQPVGATILVDTQSQKNGLLENFPAGFGFVEESVEQPSPAKNMLSFDGLGSRVSLPEWRAEGDFTITLSDVIFGDNGAVDGLLATLFGNGSFGQYSGLADGGGLVGSSNKRTNDDFLVGHRAAVVIKREGEDISIDIEGGSGPAVLSKPVSPYIIDRIGDLNGNKLFAFDGAIAGTLTMIDHLGGDNRTYDFNQANSSTTLVDTQSGQDGTLQNFTTGFGFVNDSGRGNYVRFKVGDNNRVAIPGWTATGDYSITFSDVIIGSEGITRTEVIASSKALADQEVYEFIAFQGGRLYLYLQGDTVLSADTLELNEGDRVEITLSRTGTTVTADMTGLSEPVTLESSGPFTIDSFGTYGDKVLSMNGAIGGTVTMIDYAGGDNRIYDFNQPVGSAVLVDTQSGRNGTLQSFDSGFGFVEDPYAFAPDVIDLGAGADVWILAGQSQMEGVNPSVAGVNDVYDGLESIYQYGYTGRVKPATNALEHSALYTTTNRFGLWREFALEIINNGLANGRPQLLIPVAVGGSGFPDWSPEGKHYENMVNRVNDAMATNNGNVLRGVLWAQGESNLNDSTTTHQSNLEGMHSEMIMDIGAMTASTPFVSLLLHPDEVVVDSTVQDVIDINTAIMNFSNGLERSAVIDSSDLILNFDAIHFSPESVRMIGKRYAEQFYSLLN